MKTTNVFVQDVNADAAMKEPAMMVRAPHKIRQGDDLRSVVVAAAIMLPSYDSIKEAEWHHSRHCWSSTIRTCIG